MTSADAKAIKQKQYVVLIVLIVGLLLAVYIGVRVTAPPEKKEVTTKPTESINIGLPGDQLRDEDAWRGVSDHRLAELETTKTETQARMKRFESMLEGLQRQAQNQTEIIKFVEKERQEKQAEKDKAKDQPKTAQKQQQGEEFSYIPPIPDKPQAYPPGDIPGAINQAVAGKLTVKGVQDTDQIWKNRLATISFGEVDKNGKVTDRAPGTLGRTDQQKKSQQAGSKKKKVKSAENYMPSGSFVRGIMLAGLEAPTGGQAQSSPHPVLLMLSDHGQMPNHYRGKIKECHALGSGYGDIASERAYIRMERLSCILKDKTVVDVPFAGYVVGEDGKVGLKGTLISKQGRLLALSLLTGIGAGMGEAFHQSAQDISQSALGSVSTVKEGQEFEAGIYKGIGSSLERLSQYYIDLAEGIFPVISVSAGRAVEIVLTSGVEMGQADIVAANGSQSEYYERGARQRTNKRTHSFFDKGGQ